MNTGNYFVYDVYPPPYNPRTLLKLVANNELMFILVPKDTQYLIEDNGVVYASDDGSSKGIRLGKFRIPRNAVFKRDHYSLYEQSKETN